MAKVSIIIPVYNSEKYLHRCLQSIISQKYKDIEAIIVNDGSTDGSLGICNSYLDNPSVKIRVVSQPNSGVSIARNYGLSLSKGEYIMFLDSDDYMLPDMCEIMVKTIGEKSADCVVCGTKENMGAIWAPEKDAEYQNPESFKDDFVKYLSSELLSPPWNKIYKRDLIKSYFNPTVSFGEDLIFNLEYFKNCKSISFISATPFFHEKSNTDSLVNKIYASRLTEIEKVHSAVLDYYEGNSPAVHNKYLRDVVVYFRAIMLNRNISRKEKYSCFEQWIETSYLKTVNINRSDIDLKNRILLFFICHKMWTFAYMQINWRTILRVGKLC